jgi:hypothetical protein
METRIVLRCLQLVVCGSNKLATSHLKEVSKGYRNPGYFVVGAVDDRVDGVGMERLDEEIAGYFE